MKVIFYSSDYQFEVTDEEFTSILNELQRSKRVFVPRLNVFLSDMFIWAGEKPAEKNKVKLHDGTYAKWHNGRWVDYKNPDIAIDTNYYKELTKGSYENETGEQSNLRLN